MTRSPLWIEKSISKNVKNSVTHVVEYYRPFGKLDENLDVSGLNGNIHGNIDVRMLVSHSIFNSLSISLLPFRKPYNFGYVKEARLKVSRWKLVLRSTIR